MRPKFSLIYFIFIQQGRHGRPGVQGDNGPIVSNISTYRSRFDKVFVINEYTAKTLLKTMVTSKFCSILSQQGH